MYLVFYVLNFLILILTSYFVKILYFQKKKTKKKIKIGLLTNEIPPIIYGGVATWIVNFIKMFKDNDDLEIIPIFLAYADAYRIDQIKGKYENLRIIFKEEEIESTFQDIDICVNNIWIALNTIVEIKKHFPKLPVLSVCHSLIKKEHLTNLGSVYTNNFFEQEITFSNSDAVILISEAEKKYYDEFGYDKYGAETFVIYNSYVPKYDETYLDIDYSNNNIGYIGRHVPRKRPELPILSVFKTGREDIKVYNMGVDNKEGPNVYWKKLQEIFEKQLVVIPFSSNKQIIEDYWKNVGVNCITGIYEPFGYTICEALDRRIPLIVQNIDGPSEIIKDFEDFVFMYNVDSDDLISDVNNFTVALEKFWNTTPEERKENSYKARQALENFKPHVIGQKWEELFNKCIDGSLKVREFNDIHSVKYVKTELYKSFNHVVNSMDFLINHLD
jgi:glycosyltransferase involved in cell wall biosynthesis